VWYKNLDRTFLRFVTIHAFDRRTDGQTDSFLVAIVGAGIPCSAVKTMLQRSILVNTQ